MTRARSRAAPTAAWLIVAWIATTAADARALSLRSSKAEAFLGDARPGSVVVFAEAAGGPLTVTNAGQEAVTLDASVADPPSSRLKDGFDPLPDPGWVRLSGSGVVLEPGKTAEVGVSVKVPADRRLSGGQYQFDCLLRGRAEGGGALTLRTVVTLAVSDGEPPDAARAAEDSAFLLSPASARLEGVPLGRRTPVRAQGAHGLKAVDAGGGGMTVRFSPVRTRDATVRIEEGYELAPNPRWLKTGGPVRVPAGGMARADFELEVPRQDRYRGRRWAFVVAADATMPGGRTERRWWTLYVKTAQEEVER